VSLFQDIRGALTARANTASGIPSTRAYEGVPLNPAIGTPFVRYTLTPTQERPSSLGANGMTLHQGLFLIDLFYPTSDTSTGKTGTGAAEVVADAVRAVFTPGNTLTQGSTSVRIAYVERAQAIVDPDWIQIPIAVSWNLHTPT
jgi:hypothetical protein